LSCVLVIAQACEFDYSGTQAAARCARTATG
jgi:carbamoylphosphate synthase large subunit